MLVIPCTHSAILYSQNSKRFSSNLVVEGLDNVWKTLGLFLNLPNLNVIMPVAYRGQKRLFSLLELKL